MVAIPELFSKLFGWLIQQLLRGKLQPAIALAFIAVPAMAGGTLVFYQGGGIGGALAGAFLGMVVGIAVLWLVSRYIPVGVHPAHLRDLGVDPAQLAQRALAEGDYDEAREQYGVAGELARLEGDLPGLAVSLQQLGKVARLQGDDGEARLVYEKSLTIARQAGDNECTAISLHQLGVLAYWRGDDNEARRLYRESLDIFTQLGSTYAQTVRENLARLEEGHGAAPLEL